MRFVKAWGLSVLGCVAVGVGAARVSTVVPNWPDAHLLFNGWRVTPKGEHTEIGDMALKILVSPDGHQAVLSSLGFGGVHLTTIDLATHKVIDDQTPKSVWNGLAFSADGRTLFVGNGNVGTIEARCYDSGHSAVTKTYKSASPSFIAGITAGSGDALYACDELDNSVIVIDPTSMTETKRIPVSANPYAATFGGDPRYLYVSCWGGESINIIDTQVGKVVRRISVGPHPNDMALAPDGRLFVCCSGDNSVHVIQTQTLEKSQTGASPTTRLPENAREILNTSIVPTNLEGSTPVGVSISPDGKTLYVANAQNNNVMVADISDTSATRIIGFVPTGWYPTAVCATTNGLLVTQGKGLRSRANYPIAAAHSSRKDRSYDYIGDTLQGYLSFIPTPTTESLAADTETVRANTPFTEAALTKRTNIPNVSAASKARPISQRPIQHVVYVIMENRTFDQVFGDMKGVNADPNLMMYGEKVTPNRHKLAREFVTLDNTYCNGEVSVDGHAWCDSGIANDANQRSWTSSYSSHGSVLGSDDVQRASGDYIWEEAEKAGLTLKAYGEGTGNYLGGRAISTKNRGTWPEGRDMNRIDGFVSDLHASEKIGSWPNFMIVSLGEDHTAGTTPGEYTPDACVASNDLAIGKMIEAISHSKFWASTVVFFMEDDAQNGPDHVDAHRTFALVVGPHVKRHSINHSMYSTVSVLRTIEEILGLNPMTQYDGGAQPMKDCFTGDPNLAVYEKEKPRVDVFAKNTKRSPGAALSQKMDFSDYDRAPADQLNRILWAAAKGTNTPYPAVHRTFRSGS